jgi:NADH-ubiquinone oxidoreductase chain 4
LSKPRTQVKEKEVVLLQTGTTNLQILLTTEFSEQRQIFLLIDIFFASFTVKVPMVPVHI